MEERGKRTWVAVLLGLAPSPNRTARCRSPPSPWEKSDSAEEARLRGLSCTGGFRRSSILSWVDGWMDGVKKEARLYDLAPSSSTVARKGAKGIEKAQRGDPASDARRACTSARTSSTCGFLTTGSSLFPELGVLQRPGDLRGMGGDKAAGGRAGPRRRSAQQALAAPFSLVFRPVASSSAALWSASSLLKRVLSDNRVWVGSSILLPAFPAYGLSFSRLLRAPSAQLNAKRRRQQAVLPRPTYPQPPTSCLSPTNPTLSLEHPRCPSLPRLSRAPRQPSQPPSPSPPFQPSPPRPPTPTPCPRSTAVPTPPSAEKGVDGPPPTIRTPTGRTTKRRG